MKLRLLFLLSIALLEQFSLQAATYYVAMTGSDASNGSQVTPWATIQKAANTVLPGDTVNVLPGDYGELVNLARDASPSQPITFQSSGARTGGFNCRKADYVIRGFDLNGTNTSMTAASALVYVYAEAHRLQILDNYFHNATNKYGVWLGQGIMAVPASGSSYCLVSNNSFVAIDYININCNGVSNRFVRNVFKDSNGQADCFRLWGEGHVASDNLVTNLSNISENHTDFFQVFGPSPARNSNDYSFVRNIVLERNVIVNSRIQICQLETFENPPGNMTNLVFRNNLFVNLLYAANVDMDGTKWFNNHFYRCNTGNGGHVFAFGGPKGSAYGTEIKNNIFNQCGNGADWVGWYPTVGGVQGITNFNISADYNFVCGPNFSSKITNSASGWGAQGQEVHGINGGDPKFMLPGQNFRLVLGSPLINSGAAVPGYNDDLTGITRDLNWDIGPYEFRPGNLPGAPTNLRRTQP